MLERTLGGIQENLEGFQELGVGSEQIVVVVMQDGIEKTNKGIISKIYDSIDKNLGIADESILTD